jgi:acyl carrier protein
MDVSRAQITQKVIELAAAQAGVEPETVTPDTHFVNDLNYDSLDGVDFSMKIEDAFHLTMPDTDADKLDTVSKVVDYVTRRNTTGDSNASTSSLCSQAAPGRTSASSSP